MLTAKQARDLMDMSDVERELLIIEDRIRACALECKNEYVHRTTLSTNTIYHLRNIGYNVDVSINAVRIKWGDNND